MVGRVNFGVEGERGVAVVLYARIWWCCGEQLQCRDVGVMFMLMRGERELQLGDGHGDRLWLAAEDSGTADVVGGLVVVLRWEAVGGLLGWFLCVSRRVGGGEEMERSLERLCFVDSSMW